MSLESVRAFFAEKAPDIAVIVTEQSSATVALAAGAHGVEPAQIAKTICARVGEDIVLIVAAGTARLSNRKFKDRFAAKPRMLDADRSLSAFAEVVPAAGATNAAVRIAPERMAALVNAEWVDVCE